MKYVNLCVPNRWFQNGILYRLPDKESIVVMIPVDDSCTEDFYFLGRYDESDGYEIHSQLTKDYGHESITVAARVIDNVLLQREICFFLPMD